MFTAMNRIRVQLLDVVRANIRGAARTQRIATALNQIIDLELAIMLETYREDLVEKNRNAERLRLLIEDLLAVSELESGRVTLDLQPVALPPLVEKVFNDFKARANPKEIQLVNRAPDLAARANIGRLEQVFGNLIDNAIKYGRAGGAVTVGARAMDGAQIEIFVQDDGPGIPPAALDRLFERFYRVDKARSREQGGTGLGLAIVKHIVQNHGGRIRASSQLGKGTTFFFTLPQA